MKSFFAACFLIACTQQVMANGPVVVNDTVTVSAGHNDTLPVYRQVTDPGGGTLIYSLISPALHGAALIIDSNQILYVPQPGYFGIDSFTYKVCDTFGLCAQGSVYITLLGTTKAPVVALFTDTFNYALTDTIINVLANDYDSLHEPLTVTQVLNFDSSGILGILVLDSTGAVVFQHYPLSCGTESFQYVVCNYSLCDTGLVTLSVTCPGNFFLPQGFSPNGDGINDMLVFPQLGYFPNSSLKVFNRYGTVVYQSTDYQNNWDGTDVDTMHPLPDGTYFYVLNVSDGRNFNNYIIINR